VDDITIPFEVFEKSYISRQAFDEQSARLSVLAEQNARLRAANDLLSGPLEKAYTQLSAAYTRDAHKVGEYARLYQELREEVMAKIAASDAELVRLRAENAKTCAWRLDTNPDAPTWRAECGAEWCLIEDGPVENGMVYCPRCGKRLAVLPAPPEPCE
jgi:hypothetical protein